MGHALIGNTPQTRAWKGITSLISSGADEAKVAAETLRITEKAYAWVQGDAGFREAVWLLTQLGIAAGNVDPMAHLAQAGLVDRNANSLVDVVFGVTEALDAGVEKQRARSDFGEVSRRALASAVTGYLGERLGGLFEPTKGEMDAAFKALRKPEVFGRVFRSFVSSITYETLDYFLSRELSKHLGHRFQTANQKAQYERALRTHCHESAVVVETYSSEWFSKNRYEQGGHISRESAEGFGWYGMQKLRAELKARAKNDTN